MAWRFLSANLASVVNLHATLRKAPNFNPQSQSIVHRLTSVQYRYQKPSLAVHFAGRGLLRRVCYRADVEWRGDWAIRNPADRLKFWLEYPKLAGLCPPPPPCPAPCDLTAHAALLVQESLGRAQILDMRCVSASLLTGCSERATRPP